MKSIVIILMLSSSFLNAQNSDWSDVISLTNEEKINTENPEFSACYWQDYMVYLSSRPRKNQRKKDLFTSHYDLYFTAVNSNKRLERSAVFSKELNSVYDEGPSVFADGGNKVFFTKMDYEGAEHKGYESAYLQIFESRLVLGKWTDVQKISINQELLHSCHPTTDSEHKVLIFSSDRPEGFGKMDLYISINIYGEWSEPRNLGHEINTPGNDWFPFLHDNGYLFYSSDIEGKGLDVFRVKIEKGATIGNRIKLPSPINSDYDDFSLICDRNGMNGYLSSNRPGGKGSDDIYAYESSKSLFAFGDKTYNLINLTVRDKQSGLPFAEAKVRFKKVDEEKFKAFDDSIFLFDRDDDVDSLFTDFQGKTVFSVYDGHTLVEISGPGRENWVKVIANDIQNSTLNVDLIKKPKKEPVSEEPVVVKQDEVLGEVDMNVGAIMVFDNIYYDYNSYEIQKGAALELEALSRIMRENHDLKIKLTAHTDSRGETKYNLDLSNRRALAAKNYLIQRGVNPINIRIMGLGETEIRNHCRDGVPCSDEDHNFNRRTEVQIIAN